MMPPGDDSVPYPHGAPLDEKRRAFVLEAIGTAASEMDTQTLSQMILDVSELLRTGEPPAARKLRPVR